MNLVKKLFATVMLFTLPLMGMNTEMSTKKALQLFGFAKGTITKEQMKARYIELAKKGHPDQAQDKDAATVKMQEIVNAYDILKVCAYPLDVKELMKQSESGLSPFHENWFKKMEEVIPSMKKNKKLQKEIRAKYGKKLSYQEKYEDFFSEGWKKRDRKQLSQTHQEKKAETDEDRFLEAVNNGDVAAVAALLKKNNNLANMLVDEKKHKVIDTYVHMPEKKFYKIYILHVALHRYFNGMKDALKIIELLFQHGATPNHIGEIAKNIYDRKPFYTPLGYILNLNHEITSKYDMVSLLRLFIKYKADVNALCDSEYGMTPLCSVIQNNYPLDIVELLLQNGADPNKEPNPEIYRSPAKSPLASVFMRHDKKEQVPLIKMLLKYGAKVNNTAWPWYAPLKIAVQQEASAQVIHTLLDAGARIFTEHVVAFAFGKERSKISDDIFLERFNKRQAIKRALLQQQVERNIKAAQQHSWFHYSTKNTEDVRTFFEALKQGDVDKITLMVLGNPKFATVRLVSNNVSRPSLLIVQGNRWDVKGIDKNQKLKIAKLLVSYGADLDARPEPTQQYSDHSALVEALMQKNSAMVKFLLQSGARVDYDYAGYLSQTWGKEIADILEEELNGPMPVPRSKL